jgi:hypothetical protein
MAGNLKARLNRVARRIGRASGEVVVIWENGVGGGPPARPIEEQRAAIGPNDTVIVVRYVKKGPADG